jgi:uncharacterized protein
MTMPYPIAWVYRALAMVCLMLCLSLTIPPSLALGADSKAMNPADGQAPSVTSDVRPPTYLIHIASGFSTGVYYAIGTRICQLMNRDRQNRGRRCGVGMTGGSRDNRALLEKSVVEFSLIQGDLIDWQPDSPLRGVMRLHQELIYFALKPELLQMALSELPWERMRIGVVGSGSYAAAKQLLSHCGMATDDIDIPALQQLSVREVRDAIGQAQLDGFIIITGMSSPFVTELLESSGFLLYPFPGPPTNIQSLVYQPATIPAGTYPNQTDSIATFGAHAVLLTHERVSNTVVEALLREVWDNFEIFRQVHPSLQNLQLADLAGALPLPRHPAAERYFASLAKPDVTAPAVGKGTDAATGTGNRQTSKSERKQKVRSNR